VDTWNIIVSATSL